MDALTSALSALLDGRDRDRAAGLLAQLVDPRALARLSPADLVATQLVRPHEAARIAAAFTLVSHALEARPSVALDHPALVARLVPELRTSPLEELWLVTVDTRLRPLSRERVALGGPDRCAVSTPALLRRAVASGASGCFLLHNHPSGDPTPSALDRRFTAEVRRRAAELELVLHDHVVVAGLRWASCTTRTAGVLLDEEPPADRCAS